jgi:hypothetical protein
VNTRVPKRLRDWLGYLVDGLAAVGIASGAMSPTDYPYRRDETAPDARRESA